MVNIDKAKQIRNSFFMRYYPHFFSLSQHEIEANKCCLDQSTSPLSDFKSFLRSYNFSVNDRNFIKTFVFGKNNRFYIQDHNFEYYGFNGLKILSDLFNRIDEARGINNDLPFYHFNACLIDGSGNLLYPCFQNLRQYMAFGIEGILSVAMDALDSDSSFEIDGDNSLSISVFSESYDIDGDTISHMTSKFMHQFNEDISSEIERCLGIAKSCIYSYSEYDSEGALRPFFIINDNNILANDIYKSNIDDIISDNFIYDEYADIEEINVFIRNINNRMFEKYSSLIIDEYNSIKANDVSVLKRKNRKTNVSNAVAEYLLNSTDDDDSSN